MNNVGSNISSFGTVALGIFGFKMESLLSAYDTLGLIVYLLYILFVAGIAFCMGFFGEQAQKWFESQYRKYREHFHKKSVNGAKLGD